MNRSILSCTIAALAVAQVVGAQTATVRTPAQDRIVKIVGGRVPAGVTVSSATSPRDTLGILISAVASGSAAEKAGLAEGNRIASINGVNLKISAADVNQMDMQGIMARRFQREMARVRPGDPIKFSVYADSRYRDVTVQTEPLKATTLHSFVTEADADKASLGAMVGGTASKRDSLGVLIMEVAENGPLAKSGIYEGSRIASIGSVDLRVPAATAGDARLSSEKANLLVSELGKLTAGGNAELRVYDNGRFRNVTVKTMRRGDVELQSSLGRRTILRSGGNVIGHMDLPDLNQLQLQLDTALLHLDRHVIDGLNVDDMVRTRIERVMPQLRLRLEDGLNGLQVIPHLLNGRIIAASY